MKKQFVCLLAFTLIWIAGYAQGVISGVVMDEKRHPLEFVNVALLAGDSALIAGTVTDRKGQFVVEKSAEPFSLIKFSFVGYQTVFVNVAYTEAFLKIVLKKQTKELEGVMVQASSVSQQIDRKIFVPLKMQVDHSGNGLELLEQMQLPGLEVNLLHQSLTSVAANGSVQLRVDGVMATAKDVLALEPSRIVKIEYIDMPGVKYGRSVALVLNVITRHPQKGYSGGVNLYNSVASPYGKDGVWLKMNRGKSETGFRYSFNYTAYNRYKSESEQALQMTDEEVLHISRKGVNDGYAQTGHTFAVTYNWRNADKNTFHVMFSLNSSRLPLYDYVQHVQESGFHQQSYSSSTSVKDYSSTPSLQMNYTHSLGGGQFVSAYLVGSYAGSDYRRRYEAEDYVSDYTVDGEKYNLYSELNYEKKWTDKSVLSAGCRYNYSHTFNRYEGSTGDVDMKMHDQDLNVYVQYQGRWGNLGYTLGLNGWHQYFKEGAEHYTYNSLIPDVSLNYQINADWNVALQSSCVPILPSLVDLSEVEQWQNNYEMVRGNASIEPYRSYQNQMTVQYNHKNLLLSAMFYYQRSNHCINQNTVERVGSGEDAYFLYTQSNDSKFTHLQGRFYFRLRLFDGKLALSGLAGLNRHLIRSSQYAHAKTSFFCQLSANAYLKRWQVGGRFMGPVQSVFNEEFNKTYPTADIYVGYKYKRCTVRAGVMNPFLANGKRYVVENRSAMAKKYTSVCSRDFGNMAYLSFSWSFAKGSKSKSGDIELRKTNIDAGIVK